MPIDARQLRYFVAVAEEHHFGRAAERLLMAQPPLSQQIRQLERSLGTELLVRTTRKVELNEAGELLLVRGRRILEELQSLETDVRRVAEGLQGNLRIGFTGSATYGVMPRVVRESALAFPLLALTVSGEMLTPQLTRELVEQRIDIALLRPPVKSDEIAYQVVSHERMVLAMPSLSPLAQLDSVAFDDLAGQVFVGYPVDSVVSQIIAQEWHTRGTDIPAYTQRVGETSTLLSLVAAGIGIAFVPESAMSLSLNGAVFREVVGAPTVDLAIAWRRSDASPAVQNFIPFIDRVIRDGRKDTT
jgi:DNA-binding transcriptional LysR family regulator